MKFKTLRTIAATIAAGNIAKLPGLIDTILDTETGKHWIRDLTKLKLIALDGVPRFTVHAIGNGKLPFMAFSSLPGFGFCPGAGDCLNWCYSFRAWRYPAAFARQCQNSILMRTVTGRAAILAALDTTTAKLQRKNGAPEIIDFRLYVDGDFRNAAQVKFWFNAIAARSQLAVYGYSKSWSEILRHAAQGGVMPDNYLLNLSSGSRHGSNVRDMLIKLAITRGDFIAVNIGRTVHSSDHGTRKHNAELRAAYKAQTGRKAFTCPGACGDCTPTGHACGSERFRNIDIIIAVH